MKSATHNNFPGINLEEELEEIQSNGSITLNLLVTLVCNYECDHCFFSSGPHAPRGWMSNAVLGSLEMQIRRLQDLNLSVDLNLIGGEPTLIPSKFRRYLRWMNRMHNEYGCSMEMSTNGWWLENDDKCRRIMQIISEEVEDFGIDEQGFSVRISNDKWHQAYHKRRIDQRLLHSLWDIESPLLTWRYACENCYKEYDKYPSDGLCECGGEVVSEANRAINVPDPRNQSSSWIYVESNKYGDTVIPTGRAGENNIGTFDAASEHCAIGVLTYRPDGTLSDVCTRGSNLPIGNAFQDPIALLLMARIFNKHMRPSCWKCNSTSIRWAQAHANKARVWVQSFIYENDLQDTVHNWQEPYIMSEVHKIPLIQT